MRRRVLVIEDNHDIAELVKLHLRDCEAETDIEHSGTAGLARARSHAYDLVILDLMLPGLDGLEVCRRLRERRAYIPILMLTARSAELDRVLGLEMGADDYLTKPFSIRELIARVRAIFRRVGAFEAAAAPGNLLEQGELRMDRDRHSASLRGETLELTAREFDLLWHFASHPGRVYRREQLLDQVWGAGYEGYEHTVNSHINRLRVKIETDPARPQYILTVWGVGYKFNDAAQPASR
ncbi:MAG: response regulator transcription factor [Gammaproteobacteria bacterium]|jgi:DNA-binding response OmpR family regulator